MADRTDDLGARFAKLHSILSIRQELFAPALGARPKTPP